MLYLVESIGQFDCGTTALKIYLANQSKNRQFLSLDVYKENASMLDLVQLAARYQIVLKGYHADGEALLKLNQSAIVHLRIASREHYAVFIKRKKRKVILLDPTCGKIVMNRELFIRQFSGHYLLSGAPIEAPANLAIKIKVPIFDLLLLIGSQIASAFALLFGLASFQSGNSALLTISLLAIVGILTVLTRHQQMTIQVRLFKKYVNPYLSTKSKEPFLQYQGMVTAITSYLKHIFSFIQTGTITFTLMILMISLGWPLELGLVLIILLLLGEQWFNCSNKERLRDFSMQEDDLLHNGSSIVRLDIQLQTFQKQLIRHVESRQIISYLSLVLIFSFHFLWMAFSQEIYLGQLLFNFFLSLTFYQQCQALIPLITRLDKLDSYQTQYLHYQRVKG